MAFALISSVNTVAQISLEKTYYPLNNSTGLSVVNLSVGKKYMFYDGKTNYCVFYNIDHSFWKSITIPIPLSLTNYNTGLFLVSDQLFNPDPLLEFMLVSYRTSTVNTTKYVSTVVNENGLVLWSIDNCYYPYIYNMGVDGYKLLAKVDSSIGVGAQSFQVYSLPGTLPSMQSVSSINMGGDDNYLSPPIPNPSDNKVIIPYQLEKGSSSSEIVFYNVNGIEVRRFVVDGTFNSLEIDNSNLPSGTYLYRIGNDCQKMVIIH